MPYPLILGVLVLGALALPGPAQADANAAANMFFAKAFEQRVALSPQFQSYLGIKADYDKWDDLSEQHARTMHDLMHAQLAQLREQIDYAALDAATRVSYELFEHDARQQLSNFKFRDHNYPVNQMSGLQSSLPAFLVNIHRISSVDDAQAYIARLNGVQAHFAQLLEGLERRAQAGIVAPKFVFPYVISDSREVLKGAPFDNADADSTLLADFRSKVAALNLPQRQERALVSDAVDALLDSVQPAYQQLIDYVSALQRLASDDDGAWKLPDGAAFYRQALAGFTTTSLTPDEIHQIGLSEVARIHGLMRTLMAQVGFQGELQQFFTFLREDSRFYYPNTEAGRQAYLREATRIIEQMDARLNDLFVRRPKARVEVRKVEAFREKSAGKAFYQRPSASGDRPGVYYANLYRMSDMPIYQMQALAYHEGIPGHHVQIAVAQELENVPDFRRWGRYTAYSEGWGLYAEYLPSEYGLYDDPYADFGRLAMELWRACRLVVDTGIHWKRWTRVEAIDYLARNTPNPRGDIVKAIERYIVMPGQATAYKIGQLRILSLRERTRQQLCERFDIREFHEAVLRNGPVPLDVLDRQMQDYVQVNAPEHCPQG